MAQPGSGHPLLLDDAAGGTVPKPIEPVGAALAGCTAFHVIAVLRQKYHQKVTGYEVQVEADQADRPAGGWAGNSPPAFFWPEPSSGDQRADTLSSILTDDFVRTGIFEGGMTASASMDKRRLGIILGQQK